MARQRDVCRYYLQGRCHYGANCRFLHPPRNQQQQQQQGIDWILTNPFLLALFWNADFQIIIMHRFRLWSIVDCEI